jgi:16S rRNA (guanine527-N7)-methyltransferase
MHIIEKYFLTLLPLQSEQFSQLGPLYNYWNNRINLISRKDIDNLYLHHVLHSLSIAKFINFKPEATVIDAGTGGGFPGIPLAILHPHVNFILVDSIEKKIRVVDAIIHEIGLMNCVVRNLRLEKLPDKCDFVVCRAVAELPKLFCWINKNIIPGGTHKLKNGLLALKGGNLEKEIKSVDSGVIVFDLKEYFNEAFFDDKKLVYIPR